MPVSWLLVAALAGAQPRTLCDIAEFLPAYDAEPVSLRGEIFIDAKQGNIAWAARDDRQPHPLKARGPSTTTPSRRNNHA